MTTSGSEARRHRLTRFRSPSGTAVISARTSRRASLAPAWTSSLTPDLAGGVGESRSRTSPFRRERAKYAAGQALLCQLGDHQRARAGRSPAEEPRFACRRQSVVTGEFGVACPDKSEHPSRPRRALSSGAPLTSWSWGGRSLQANEASTREKCESAARESAQNAAGTGFGHRCWFNEDQPCEASENVRDAKKGSAGPTGRSIAAPPPLRLGAKTCRGPFPAATRNWRRMNRFSVSRPRSIPRCGNIAGCNVRSHSERLPCWCSVVVVCRQRCRGHVSMKPPELVGGRATWVRARVVGAGRLRWWFVVDDETGDALGAWEQPASADDPATEHDALVMHQEDVGEDGEHRAG